MFHPGPVSMSAPQRKSDMKTINRKFDSLAALSAFIAGNDINGWFAANGYNSSETNGRDFTGTENFEDAENLMLHGWQEGAERVRAAMVESASMTSERPRRYNSVVGFAPNVARYVQGHPLNMINKKRVRVPARVVTICYNSSVGYEVSAANIEKTAARLFNVISGLEKSGVRVELWVLNLSVNAKIGFKRNKPYVIGLGNERLNFAVRIKTASQPFNLLKMVYPVVHPSFSRRHGFAVKERAGLEGEPNNYDWEGYGVVVHKESEVKNACAALGIKTENVFSYYNLSGKTEKQIADMIK